MSKYDKKGEIKEIKFFIPSAEEIERISQVKVISPDIKNEKGGLFDLRMGPAQWNEGICQTCHFGGDSETFEKCFGHYGHISLPTRIYSHVYITDVAVLLRIICHKCSNLLVGNQIIDEIDKRPIKQDMSRFIKKHYYETTAMKSGSFKCAHCKKSTKLIQTRITNKNKYKQILIHGPLVKNPTESEVIYAEEAYKILSKIPEKVLTFLNFSVENHPKNMIIKNIPVVPPMLRPMLVRDEGGSEKRSEHTLTSAYRNILRKIKDFKNKLSQKGKTKPMMQNDYRNEVVELSIIVQILYDTSFYKDLSENTKKIQQSISADKKTLFQIMGKKEGIITSNIVGKRVENSARSVICGETLYDIDQLGVPKRIAQILTFPEKVTSSNIKRLEILVMNGENKYPGANEVIDGKTGERRKLRNQRIIDSIKLSIGDIVERHLIDEDYILFNRQPTLLKNSFMSFRIKVIEPYAFRLNLAVVQPFNADFDGDEMNLFLPRTIESREEVRILAGIKQNMISEANGGLQILPTQDSILSVAMMTKNDTLLSRNDFLFVVQHFANMQKQLPIPDVGKKISGKIALSHFLPKINLKNSNESYFSNDATDKRIDIENGIIKSGVFTKSLMRKIVSLIYHEEIDNTTAFNFVNEFGKFSNLFLILHGLSFGFSDVSVHDEKFKNDIEDEFRIVKQELKSSIKKIYRGVKKMPIGVKPIEYLENKIPRKIHNKLINLFSENLSPFLTERKWKNNLFEIVNSGVKGSSTHVSQIMLKVGMQTMDGKFIKRRLNERITPYSMAGNLNLHDIGFVDNPFSDGMLPREFFYSIRTGRKGKIDQQTTTGDIGYASKKINRSNEDNIVRSDFTVKNADGDIIQFMYGFDGFSPGKVIYVPYLLSTLSREDITLQYGYTDADLKKYHITRAMADEELKKLISGKELLFNHLLKKIERKDGVRLRLPVNIIRKIDNIKLNYPDSEKPIFADKVVEKTNKFVKNLSSIYNITGKVGMKSVIEHSLILLRIYIHSCLSSKTITGYHKLTEMQFDLLLREIRKKIEFALIDIGENVGMMSAQAITEPATQMVIDSFHNSSLGEVRKEGSKLQLFLRLVEANENLSSTYKLFLPENSKTSEIINDISAFTLKTLVIRSEIIYVNDLKKNNFDNIKNFFKYSKISFKEADYSHFVLKYELDKEIMFLRKIDMISLKIKLERLYKDQLIFVIPSDINISKPYIYIYIKHKGIGKILRRKNIDCMLEKIRRIKNILLDKNLNKNGFMKKASIQTKKIELYDEKTFEKYNIERKYINGIGDDVLQDLLRTFNVDNYISYSDSVQDALGTYGIEVARNVFVEELYSLMSGVSGNINIKHIEQLADTMFFTGQHISVRADGIKKRDSNALGMITFEKYVHFTPELCKVNKVVPNTGNTFAIVTGQTPKYGGTGDMMKFELDIEKTIKKPKTITELLFDF